MTYWGDAFLQIDNEQDAREYVRRFKQGGSSFIGSERESGETCILRGFLKGSYFRSAGPPKQQILARMADKPGSRCGNGAPRAERWNVSHNGSARPRSLETRKGRGFPHSHSDGDGGCQNGTNC